ncbi:hypothetical protein [Epilithonimonas sp. UC225_85]|uniref:hypothetical protein n=1 Tax=Epilithonimonas sp. UC225_85 TaxID=3350167 RepID=UPI0036D42F45
MKTFFTILIITINSVFANAQDYKAKLTSLMKNSETDFVNIIGNTSTFKGKDGYQVYDSKLKMGVGKEFISKKDTEKAAVYTLYSEYKDAKELEKAVNEFVNSYFPASKYDIEVEKDDLFGTYFMEVFEKKAAMPFLEISLDLEKDFFTSYTITLYSKSAQY